MKTMKIIDLLNKIANGEEVPKKIEYQGTEYIFDKSDYKLYKDADLLTDDCLTRYINSVMLNDRVEIIEDKPSKIEKITMCTSGIMGYDGVENITTELKNKINDVIDKLNYLLEKSDSND